MFSTAFKRSFASAAVLYLLHTLRL